MLELAGETKATSAGPTTVRCDEGVGFEGLGGGDDESVWQAEALTETCTEVGSSFGDGFVKRYDLDREAIDEGAERSDSVVAASRGADEGFGIGGGGDCDCVAAFAGSGERPAGGFVVSVRGIEEADQDAGIDDR